MTENTSLYHRIKTIRELAKTSADIHGFTGSDLDEHLASSKVIITRIIKEDFKGTIEEIHQFHLDAKNDGIPYHEASKMLQLMQKIKMPENQQSLSRSNDINFTESLYTAPVEGLKGFGAKENLRRLKQKFLNYIDPNTSHGL